MIPNPLVFRTLTVCLIIARIGRVASVALGAS